MLITFVSVDQLVTARFWSYLWASMRCCATVIALPKIWPETVVSGGRPISCRWKHGQTSPDQAMRTRVSFRRLTGTVSGAPPGVGAPGSRPAADLHRRCCRWAEGQARSEVAVRDSAVSGQALHQRGSTGSARGACRRSVVARWRPPPQHCLPDGRSG